MSESAEWIEGHGGRARPDDRGNRHAGVGYAARGRPSPGEASAKSGSWQKQTMHSFPVRGRPMSTSWNGGRGSDWDRDPDLWLYRKKTTALLRRYMQWSLAAGRVPSLLGRELFRAKISAYTATTFEARVIFLHDVERCLGRLQSFDRSDHRTYRVARVRSRGGGANSSMRSQDD